MKETEIQKKCIEWFRYQFPNEIIFHIPNGGKRNVIEAKKFKSIGVLAGVPDLFLLHGNGKHNGLFLEMKAGKNKETENQKKFFVKATEKGYLCQTVYSLEEFISVINNYYQNKQHMKKSKITPETNLLVNIKALRTYGVAPEIIADMLDNLNEIIEEKEMYKSFYFDVKNLIR